MKKVFLNKEYLRELNEKGVFLTKFGRDSDFVRRGGRDFFYPEECKIGSSSCILSGIVFPSNLGTYSYSGSPLDGCLSIGNYCSISDGLRIMERQHPIERFTTSSITYDKVSPMFNSNNFKMKKIYAPPEDRWHKNRR